MFLFHYCFYFLMEVKVFNGVILFYGIMFHGILHFIIIKKSFKKENRLIALITCSELCNPT